eukprot:364349-Chlamydomonas_euryale.AAC.17
MTHALHGPHCVERRPFLRHSQESCCAFKVRSNSNMSGDSMCARDVEVAKRGEASHFTPGAGHPPHP